MEGAVANFDCVVGREIEAAIHTLFLARVLSVCANENGRPLIYGNGRFTSLIAEA